ncbi:MAG: hypothetical protein R2765_04695 [Ferruginibacter sp.]
MGQTDAELIFNNGSIEVVRKDDIIFHEKKINAFEYFQLIGVSHRFNVDTDMQTVTTGIYQNEIVITPHFTRTTNDKSIFSLQALTECHYLKIPAGIFREISDQNLPIKMFGRAVEKVYKKLKFRSAFPFPQCKGKVNLFPKKLPPF